MCMVQEIKIIIVEDYLFLVKYYVHGPGYKDSFGNDPLYIYIHDFYIRNLDLLTHSQTLVVI